MARQKFTPSELKYRTRHRTRAQSHADTDEPSEPVQIPAHPLIPADEAALIQEQPQLDELIEHLKQTKCFAYDSEFIGELTYVPKICLIQVATAQRIALIDPLAKLNLRTFWELIADPSLLKIIHAGQQDLEPVVRHLNRPPANVFDTQIVAGFVGLTYPVSLSRLVQDRLGVKLPKAMTVTQWDQRPLSRSQRRYAANDVRYLPAIHALLQAELEQRGRVEAAQQECNTLCDSHLYHFDPDVQIHRVHGARSLEPPQLAILRELVIWRDGAAQQQDIPPRTLVRDEILVDLSRNGGKKAVDLSQVRGMRNSIRTEYEAEIASAIQRGLNTPSADLPSVHQNNEGPQDRFRIDALWAMMQSLCASQGIDPALASSKHDVEDFFHLYQDHAGQQSIEQAMMQHRLMQGWRRTVAGQTLLELLQGKKTVTMHWTND